MPKTTSIALAIETAQPIQMDVCYNCLLSFDKIRTVQKFGELLRKAVEFVRYGESMKTPQANGPCDASNDKGFFREGGLVR